MSSPLIAADILLTHVRRFVAAELHPQAAQIDLDRRLPDKLLAQFASLGPFELAVPESEGGRGPNFTAQIAAINTVAAACGASALLLWHHFTALSALAACPPSPVRSRLLAALVAGTRFASVDAAHIWSSLEGLDAHSLTATRVEGGFRIHGIAADLPRTGANTLGVLVAQIRPAATGARLAEEGEARHLVFVQETEPESPAEQALHEPTVFSACRLTSLHFDNDFVADSQILAQPAQAAGVLAQARIALLLHQLGHIFGIVEGCLQTIRESGASSGCLGAYFTDHEEVLTTALSASRAKARRLAVQADAGRIVPSDLLRLRLHAAQLALRSAQAAVQHAGLRGLETGHAAQRRLREACHVATATPSIPQLRKALALFDRRMRQRSS